MSVAALVLCAGASRRMGRPKALLPVRDGPGAEACDTFLGRILRLARRAGAAPVVVVAEPHGAAIRAAFAGDAGIGWAENPDPGRGMLSSVQAGLRALPEEAEGVLVWPVDVPLLQPATAEQVLRQAEGMIAVPVHGDRPGHPLFVPRRFFAEVLALPVHLGLRQLRRDHPEAVRLVAVDDPAVLRDVDTPEDLSAAWQGPPHIKDPQSF